MSNNQTHLVVYKGLDGRFPKKDFEVLMVDLDKKKSLMFVTRLFVFPRP